MIAVQMTNNSEKDELLKTFEELDKNKDGVLKDELIQGYQKVFFNEKKAEELVHSIWNEINLNDDGDINFTEFLVAALNRDKLLSKQKIEQAFQLFDLDRNDYITKLKLQTVMGSIEMNDEDVKALLQDGDENNDGKISYEEFIHILMKGME